MKYILIIVVVIFNSQNVFSQCIKNNLWLYSYSDSFENNFLKLNNNSTYIFNDAEKDELTFGIYDIKDDTLFLFQERGQFDDSVSADSPHRTGKGLIKFLIKNNGLIPIFAQYSFQNNLIPPLTTFDSVYKLILFCEFASYGNPRFNFWFDYPNDWQIFDLSDNGDGYKIIPKGELKTDIRIYGSNMFDNNNQEGKIFEYYDKSIGKIIRKNNEIRIIKYNSDSIIVLYVSASEKWIDKNLSLLKAIGMSIRKGNR